MTTETRRLNNISFVKAGIRYRPIWEQITNQVYLGDSAFIDRVQAYLDGQKADLQIPKVQKRAKTKSIAYYDKAASNRNDAILNAYGSGAYSYQELGNYFGLHLTTIGKIIRGNE